MILLWQLFVSYLKIGFFGFGGGYAMLSLIQNEVVVQHQWLTNAQFADIVAISQITPGPIAINSATYVGYSVGMQTGYVWCGVLGSAIATFAVCLPSLTLMIAVLHEAEKQPVGRGGHARNAPGGDRHDRRGGPAADLPPQLGAR